MPHSAPYPLPLPHARLAQLLRLRRCFRFDCTFALYAVMYIYILCVCVCVLPVGLKVILTQRRLCGFLGDTHTHTHTHIRTVYQF